eukprot:INCI6219.9.p1 GENE.INCI6219.9~~INCI6219.9.p1  ORF type:complete len:221 (-),score=45.67 INCI6219.9:459-1121(-)
MCCHSFIVDMNDADQRDAVQVETLFQEIHLSYFASAKKSTTPSSKSCSTGRSSPTNSQPAKASMHNYGDGSVSALSSVPLERHVVKTFFADVTTAAQKGNSFYPPISTTLRDDLQQLIDCIDYVLPLPLALTEFKNCAMAVPAPARTNAIATSLTFGASSRTSTFANDRIEGERKREERILAKTETLFGYMDINDDKSVDKEELVQFFSLETGLGRGQAK